MRISWTQKQMKIFCREEQMDTTQFIAVILAVVAVTSAVPQQHTFESRYGDDIVAIEEIEVDEEAQSLLATITPVKGNLIPTVNFHDFAAGYTAIKDEQRETCYVMEVSHTLQEMMDNFEQSVKSNGFFDTTKHFACTNKQYVPNSEVERYGDRIANFCRDHEVVYSDKHFLSRERRALNMMAGPALLCGVCIGYCP